MNEKGLLKSNTIYFTGLLLLVAGLPVSLFLTSLSQFVLLVAFLFEGNIKEKLIRFFLNKIALLLSGIWIIHLFGLLWTSDLAEGTKDLRIKLPLLLLPLFIGGSRPLSAVQFRWLLITFVFAVFCGTMVSMAVLTDIIHRDVRDIRDVFIFHISHIRFALFTCLSVFILYWLAFRDKTGVSRTMKILSGIFIAWFLIFLLIVESVTGLVIFSIVTMLLLLYHAFTSGSILVRIVTAVSVVVVPMTLVFIVGKFVDDFYKKNPYPVNTSDKTALGNGYMFNLEDPFYENGYPVWVYVCEDELRSEWNKMSEFKYDSTDERKQLMKYTLIRFLASKGLRKDAEGVRKLTIDERRAIEMGIANVNYQDISSLRSRLLQIMWEFDEFIKGRSSSGHSVTQRFEFWKAAWEISKDNFLIGVGTGDMTPAYKAKYIEMNSKLKEEHRHRAHNQFLAILVALGVIGLLYFLLAFFYPVLSLKKNAGFLFIVVFLISLLSMFTEDTLETQPGATFVAFFFTVFLFAMPEKNDDHHFVQ